MSVSVMLEQEQSIGPSPLSEEQLRDLRPLTELADEDLVVAHLDGRPGAFQHLRTPPLLRTAAAAFLVAVSAGVPAAAQDTPARGSRPRR